MSEPAPVVSDTESVVARGGAYYRNTRYVMMIVLILAGGWFAYDGWIGWPKINRQIADLTQQIDQAKARGDEHTRVMLTEQVKGFGEPHTDLSLLLQKVLAFSLPPLGILMVVWALYNSRGEIRMVNKTLSAPGHPIVTFDQIAALDRRLWDRKDIAYIEYDTGQHKGHIRLDAFIYETAPIVKIFDRIEALMKEEG
jgi:hypothetical protein